MSDKYLATDRYWMSLALKLAAKGCFTASPNPMVGCILVKDGKNTGQGYHRITGEEHAETLALREAGPLARGACAYISLEPCSHMGRTPPCVEALIKAGITRAVVAMRDPDTRVAGRGIQELQSAGIAVVEDVCKEQARWLNHGYLSRIERGRPWIRVKSASSLDGKIALADGKSSWITSAQSRQDNQFWRARSCALCTSERTLKADNPRLNMRLSNEELFISQGARQPLRIIIDRRFATDLQARIFEFGNPGNTVLAVCRKDPLRLRQIEHKGVTVLVFKEKDGKSPLEEIMRVVCERFCINSVQVEAGGRLVGGLLDAGLVDEWLIYCAPCLLGQDGLGMAHLSGVVVRMEDRRHFVLHEVQRLGDDIRILLYPKGHRPNPPHPGVEYSVGS